VTLKRRSCSARPRVSRGSIGSISTGGVNSR
jgi:hypothetical protein